MRPMNRDIIEFLANVAEADANVAGEVLRTWAFTESFGCYSCFDVIGEFEESQTTEREFAFLWGRPFDKDDSAPNDYDYCDIEVMNEISWHKHPSGIEMGWHWSGDGTLAFILGGRGVLRNSDCKKDDEWEWDSA
jgi:hypothetical protein